MLPPQPKAEDGSRAGERHGLDASTNLRLCQCDRSPGEYIFARYTLHDKEPVDARGRVECKCDVPVNSFCQGFLNLFDDETCSVAGGIAYLSSTGEGCGAIMPFGRAVGSKSITGISYKGGTCAGTGGAPIGIATPDPSPDRATTFCCHWPFDDIN